MTQKGTFKVGINNLISWGASIVIIGLMAKLQSWAWGDWMIVVGLGTEAVLFFILGFQRDEDTPVTEPVAVVAKPHAGTTAALDDMLHQADVSQELIGRLGEGLRQFGTRVEAISNVSDASLATSRFADTLSAATEGFTKLNASFEKTTQELAVLGESRKDVQVYQEQVSELANNLQQLNENLASLNAVYSNMLAAMNQQPKA